MDPQNPNLGLILDFAVSKPGRQAEIIQNQHRMLTDPERRPQDYYRAIVSAIKSAAADPMPDKVLDEAVEKVAGTPKERHYQALRDGFLQAWHPGDTVVSTHRTTFTIKSTGMRVNPQLGVRSTKGELSAVFLYLKEEPLSKAAVQPILFAMNEVMDEVLPGARPRILDVRAGEYFDLDRRSTHRKQTLRIVGLIGQWRAMWSEIDEAA